MSDSSKDITDGTANTAELTASEYHSLLAVDRRRLVLDILEERSTAVDLEELAEEVATRERESDDIEEVTREHVAISLHHNHLPRIDEAGLATYDPDDHIVDSSMPTDYGLGGSFVDAPDSE